MDSSAFLDQARLGWFAELNRALRDDLGDASFKTRMRSNLACLRRLAGELLALARDTHPTLDASALEALLANAPAVAADEPLLTAEWKGAA